ncbi:MAG: alcohol dehydrogenase catalytic domain-containing protein [Armatimonadota bacterium]|nr:alcohol dehydrogenase catalytic domain-containing protein [bacterium]
MLITNQTIPKTIKAVVLEGPRKLTYREIPMWPIESYNDPDMILLKVAACGVCGSDFRYYAGENPWAQHTLGRHVDNPPNIVLGHEFTGEVVGVMSEKNAHLMGKRVAPICSKTCGVCSECASGRTQLCPNTVHLGHGQGWGKQDFFPGAYAEYVPVWASGTFVIPDKLSYEETAMMDILAVCVHVAHQGEIQPGRPVLMMGAGPAGNGIAQAAKYLGASKVVITDISDIALDIARKQGIDEVVDVRGKTDEQLSNELRSHAPEGYASVFDSIGTKESFDIGLGLLGKRGTLVNMAVHDQEMPVNFLRLGSERKVTTSCNFATGDYPLALSWLETGRLSVKGWLNTIKLEDLPRVFAEVDSSTSGKQAFKMLVSFK